MCWSSFITVSSLLPLIFVIFENVCSYILRSSHTMLHKEKHTSTRSFAWREKISHMQSTWLDFSHDTYKTRIYNRIFHHAECEREREAHRGSVAQQWRCAITVRWTVCRMVSSIAIAVYIEAAKSNGNAFKCTCRIDSWDVNAYGLCKRWPPKTELHVQRSLHRHVGSCIDICVVV